MNRAVHSSLRLIVLMAGVLGTALATSPDTFSPVVSFQYLDSLDEPGSNTQITSPAVSFLYEEWAGDDVLALKTSAPVSFYYNSAPVIIQQPQSKATQVGTNVVFSVQAAGLGPLSYQWRINGANIPNTNSPTFTLGNTQASNSGKYSVMVSNAFDAAFSEDASLFVLSPPEAAFPTMPQSTPATQFLSPKQITHEPPPGPTQLKLFNAVLGRFLDFTPPLAPGKKTIVLTHGWNSSPYTPHWPPQMATALATRYGADWNILAWDWNERANSGFYAPSKAAGFTTGEGTALGRALIGALGPDYNLPIHFIGHSFGTLVNCVAADYIHNSIRPAGEPATPVYSFRNTHVTLLDEAELIGDFQGLAFWFNNLASNVDEFFGDAQGTADFSATAERARTLHTKVIPDRSAYVDNYISEVGRIHSGITNTMLWRHDGLPWQYDIPGVSDLFAKQGLHGYACEWYRRTILDQEITSPPRTIGHYTSFERTGLTGASGASAYYVQSVDPSVSYLDVTPVNEQLAKMMGNQDLRSTIKNNLVMYPTLEAYTNLTALGSKVEGAYLNGIQYAGKLTANFVGSFIAPSGEPVYSDTAGSTVAYFRQPGQTLSGGFKSQYRLTFSITPGATQDPQVKASTLATAAQQVGATEPTLTVANAAYTIIPIHVPLEAIGMSFEYQVTNAGYDDFMTFGVGEENDYSMDAKYLNNGEWNGTPVFPMSAQRNQDIQLVFALIGSNGPPSGTLSIRNIQFYIPPRPPLSMTIKNGQVTVLWPISARDWTIETSIDLKTWQPVTGAPVDSEYSHTMTFDHSGPARFYRLTK